MTEEQVTKKLNAKEAVEKASEYLHDIKGIASNQIKIEEIELTEDKKYWLVTLSYNEYLRLAIFQSLPTEKKIYKIFKVDANTGEVLSMKIREL